MPCTCQPCAHFIFFLTITLMCLYCSKMLLSGAKNEFGSHKPHQKRNLSQLGSLEGEPFGAVQPDSIFLLIFVPDKRIWSILIFVPNKRIWSIALHNAVSKLRGRLWSPFCSSYFLCGRVLL